MTIPVYLNTLRQRQNGCHFPGNIFKYIFLNENVWIPIKSSLKFVPKGPINDIPALVLIMAWRGQVTSHYPNQWWLVYLCIYASISLNELKLLSPGGFGFDIMKMCNFKMHHSDCFHGHTQCYLITSKWMVLDLIDDKSTLVQVMAWCWCDTIFSSPHIFTPGENIVWYFHPGNILWGFSENIVSHWLATSHYLIQDAKSLPEPRLTKFSVTIWRH